MEQWVVVSIIIAAYLVPTAVIGGTIGARLTHVVPVKWVRTGFLVLAAVACDGRSDLFVDDVADPLGEIGTIDRRHRFGLHVIGAES